MAALNSSRMAADRRHAAYLAGDILSTLPSSVSTSAATVASSSITTQPIASSSPIPLNTMPSSSRSSQSPATNTVAGTIDINLITAPSNNKATQSDIQKPMNDIAPISEEELVSYLFGGQSSDEGFTGVETGDSE